jgi:hypothetical protein
VIRTNDLRFIRRDPNRLNYLLKTCKFLSLQMKKRIKRRGSGNAHRMRFGHSMLIMRTKVDT